MQWAPWGPGAVDLSFKNQHVFLNSGFLKSWPHPQKHHCALKVPGTTFGLSSPDHPHKGPRPQNSTKNKHAHTETAPATLRKHGLGDGGSRFRKALLVFLRPLGLPQAEHAEAPGLLEFVVVKLSGHGLVAWNTAAWGCSSARWTHGSNPGPPGHPLFKSAGPRVSPDLGQERASRGTDEKRRSGWGRVTSPSGTQVAERREAGSVVQGCSFYSLLLS